MRTRHAVCGYRQDENGYGSGKPFIIADGGIGGLADPWAGQGGEHSLVLEQAERLGEIGAGIQMPPNAFNCFDFLGIGGALRENAVYIDRLRLMDALSGEEICHIPLDEDFQGERFGNPYAVVHRRSPRSPSGPAGGMPVQRKGPAERWKCEPATRFAATGRMKIPFLSRLRTVMKSKELP